MKEILEQKKYVLHHVLYEMQMYLALINYMNTDKFTQADTIAKNAIIESHLMHLRNLIYFFSKKKNERYQDDIHYADIVEGISELEIDDTITIKNAKGKEEKFSAARVVNKSIAHITRARFDEDLTTKTQQLIKQMTVILPETIRRFTDALETNIKKETQDKLESELKRKDIGELIASIRALLK